MARNRHTADSGYQRGEETRARIIEAALKLFGERGYDGASTRDIATAAGVNAPALQYYFDNKEGVYLACAEHIASRVWEHLGEVIEQAEQVLAGLGSGAGRAGDDDALIDAFCAIQSRTAEFMNIGSGDERLSWRLFLTREQAGLGNSSAFRLIQERVNRRSTAAMTAIVGHLLGRAADDSDTVIRTMALSGQMVIFHMLRRSALTALGWDEIDGERLALLSRTVGEQTRMVLRAMAAERDTRAAGKPAPAAAARRPARRAAKSAG